MKLKLICILFSIHLFSCGENSSEKVEKGENNKEIKKEKKRINTWRRRILNQNTNSEEIKTINVKDNKVLFSRFQSDLKEEKFVIKEMKFTDNEKSGFSNCESNTIYSIKGEGIRWYYIKRSEAKPENYYPDFTLYVYEFKTEEEAKKNYTLIKEALKSRGEFCNGKQPTIVVRNSNEIFSFSTRAEMFRNYIENFAGKIENY